MDNWTVNKETKDWAKQWEKKAGDNPDPVSGMDGASARQAIGRYQAGTKATAP